MNLKFIIKPNTEDSVREMFEWEYTKEYAFYNFGKMKEEKEDLLSDSGFGVWDEENNLAGFCIFGDSATILPKNKDYYEEGYLDIGFGLKPEFCGKGFGENFVKTIMDFGIQKYNIKKVRLTVAKFNKRAINLYKKMGFIFIKDLYLEIPYTEFQIMIFDANN